MEKGVLNYGTIEEDGNHPLGDEEKQVGSCAVATFVFLSIVFIILLAAAACLCGEAFVLCQSCETGVVSFFVRDVCSFLSAGVVVFAVFAVFLFLASFSP